MTERLQAPVFSYNDLHWLEQDEDCIDYRFWKAYWWGTHRDYQLIRRLDAEERLEDFLPSRSSIDRGYQLGSGYAVTGALKCFPVLKKSKLRRYGRLGRHDLDPPPEPARARVGNVDLYKGPRIVLSRSPRERDQNYGRIIARFETREFCFTDDIIGIRLDRDDRQSYLVLLGILWSSFARYYLWFTTSMWGTRNDKIHKGELLSLPVRFPPRNSVLERRIVEIVSELRASEYDIQEELLRTSRKHHRPPGRMHDLEIELDECIFDLYELTSEDRDLVQDLCGTGLPFFYDGWKSNAAKPNCLTGESMTFGYTLEIKKADIRKLPILDYVKTFARRWDDSLKKQGGRLAFSISTAPDESSMLAVIFLSRGGRKSTKHFEKMKDSLWSDILADLSRDSLQPMSPGAVYVDGLVRIVSHSFILIMKRNEQRLWTKSLARVDAEATWLKAMKSPKTT